jgi:hypothetical protein
MQMKYLETAVTVCCLALLVGAFSPRAKADEWNKKTVVTFNEPVEIPGMVLPAGTYVFKLMDSESDRNIVQIFNKDENHLYATILAIPDDRLKPTGKTVINFEERPAGSPEAIHSWFYPGSEQGDEFVYPKTRATELAKANNRPVLSMPSELAANITKPAKPAVAAMKKVPVKAVKPTGEEVEMAEVVMIPPMQMAAAKPPARHLPKTASPVPLVGLIGLLALGAAAGIRVISKRIA